MHCLIVVDNPRIAQSFVDYMAYRGISLSLAPDSKGVGIWLQDEERRVEVEAELQHFLADPFAKRYRIASWDMAETRTAKFGYKSPDLLSMLVKPAGPVTLTVLGAAVIIFLLWSMGFADSIFALTHFPSDATQVWQLWRLVTHSLIHFSALHLVFNCLWWWYFAGMIETRLGSNKVLQLLLFAALFSGMAQAYISGVNFGGLSGVVYALLGYVWLLGKKAPQKGVSVPNSYFVFMLLWLVFGFFGVMGLSIANAAHVVGLVTGCGIALFDVRPSKVIR